MRLGVNGFRLSGQRLGVGRYIEYMVKYWDRMLAPSDHITLYVKDPLEKNALPQSAAMDIRVLGSKLNGILWEHLVLPSGANDLDVLFCPSYTMPLTYNGKCVLANHSVNEIQPGTHPWWYHLTYRQRYRLSALRADRVIVPSEATKTHLQDLYKVSAEKIDVIPQGVDDAFAPVDDAALHSATRRRHLGTDRPYILFVGKLSQRRNIPNLITAFSLVKQRHKIPHSLLLVGPNHENLPLQQLAAELDVEDSLIQTDGRFADHRELISIYNAADMFVHPSSYEGFSLTIVEAMACGVPLITVNRGAAREIVGNSARLVEEPTAEALAEAIYQVISDPEYARTLRVKGIERARSFRYEDTARRTLEVLRQVASA